MSFDTPMAGAGRLLPLRAMDPARKLAAAGIFAVGASLLEHPSSALGACLASLTVAFLGGAPLRLMARRLVPVNLFLFFLWILLPLGLARGTPPQDTLFSFGPLAFRASGLALAGLITLKGNAIASMTLLLAGTSSIAANGHGLLRLRAPAKLVTLFLLTHANLDLMADESSRLFRAAKLRGFRPAANLASYRTCAYLAAMLLVRAWQRSRRVGAAMRLRGFQGRFPLLETAEAGQNRRAANVLLAGVCAAAVALWCGDIFL